MSRAWYDAKPWPWIFRPVTRLIRWWHCWRYRRHLRKVETEIGQRLIPALRELSVSADRWLRRAEKVKEEKSDVA